MVKLISLEIAEYLNNNGIIIDSQYCYCKSPIGIKAVKSDNTGNKLSERIYHRGTIEKVDDGWGILYPSENWCSAPSIFDVIRYLDESLNIVIIPIYKGNRLFEFNIYKDDELIYASSEQYYSILTTYNAAINYYFKKYKNEF